MASIVPEPLLQFVAFKATTHDGTSMVHPSSGFLLNSPGTRFVHPDTTLETLHMYDCEHCFHLCALPEHCRRYGDPSVCRLRLWRCLVTGWVQWGYEELVTNEFISLEEVPWDYTPSERDVALFTGTPSTAACAMIPYLPQPSHTVHSPRPHGWSFHPNAVELAAETSLDVLQYLVTACEATVSRQIVISAIRGGNLQCSQWLKQHAPAVWQSVPQRDRQWYAARSGNVQLLQWLTTGERMTEPRVRRLLEF